MLIQSLTYAPYIASGLFGPLFILTGQRQIAVGLVLVTFALSPLGFVSAVSGRIVTPAEMLAASILLSGSLSLANRARVPRWLIPAGILAGYFVFRAALAMAHGAIPGVDLVAEARPVVDLLAIGTAVLVLPVESLRIPNRWLAVAVVIFVASDAVFFYFGPEVGITPIGIAGETLRRAGILRYHDEFSLLAFGLAILGLTRLEHKVTRTLFLGALFLIPLFSLSRSLLIGAVLVVLAFVWKHVGRGFLLPLLLTTAVVAGTVHVVIVTAERSGVPDRIASRIVDPDALGGAVQYRMLEPALQGGYEANAWTLLVGEGPGFRFVIPWYVYRGLEEEHRSVDSFFVYAFVKYGLVGLALWGFALTAFLRGETKIEEAIWLLPYLAFHNGVAVGAFMLLLFMLVAISKRRVTIETY